MGIRRRWVAAVVASLLGSLAIAQTGPVTVTPQPPPPQQPVTVYYEKLPSGEIRPVSSQPIADKSGDAVAPLPQPKIEVQTLPVQTGYEVQLPAPQVRFRPVPVQYTTAMPQPIIVGPSLPPPVYQLAPLPEPMPVEPNVTMPKQTASFGFQRLPSGGIRSVSALDLTPANPEIRTVVMQQPVTTHAPLPATIPVTPPAAPPSLPVIPKSVTGLPVTSYFQDATPKTPAIGDQDEVGKLIDYGIETDPPKPERLFRMESELELQKRIRTEIMNRPRKEDRPEVVEFPTYKALTDDPFKPRQFGGVVKQIEPTYVIYDRLYFEDVNAERYGWDLGILQGPWQAAAFYKDLALLPYKFMTRPCQRFDSSAGWCFPGDPIPYLLYPPEISLTGAGWEAAIIVGGFALIP